MRKFEKYPEFNNIGFCSDLHGYHRNLCSGTTTWDVDQHGGAEKLRDFSTPEEMTYNLIENINSRYGVNDLLVHVGDFAFGGEKRIPEIVDAINPMIWNINGNHDHNIHKYEKMFYRVTENAYLNVQGQNIYLQHYPCYVWHQSHKGAWHCYGHVHGSLQAQGLALDVGFDNAFRLYGEYRPFSFEDIAVFMGERQKAILSHHNENTN